MNCPQCQAALQPGMQQCPSCSAVFADPVEEGKGGMIEAAQQTVDTKAGQQSLVVQQITNVTGIPARLVPKWRMMKPVAIVALLAPAGLFILAGLLLTGDIFKPEHGTEFFQPLDQNEKTKLAAASAVVQSILLVFILSV